MDYTRDDLMIVDDAIGLIRRMPNMFCAEGSRGRSLVVAMMRDLINHDDMPVGVERIDGWWLVTCGVDWLERQGGAGRGAWSRMIPTPEIAVNSIRSEVVLTALARALVTATPHGVEWLVAADDIPCEVQARIDAVSRDPSSGRLVAFLAD